MAKPNGQVLSFKMVGTTGFEPATYCSQSITPHHYLIPGMVKEVELGSPLRYPEVIKSSWPGIK